VPKNAKNVILWTLFVMPPAQHGKLDQTNAFSYYVGVGTTQQMLMPELMVSFPLPLHFNLSNNGTNRLFDYTRLASAGANGKFPCLTKVPIGYLATQQMLVPELKVSFPLLLHINSSNKGANRLFDCTRLASARANGKFPGTTLILTCLTMVLISYLTTQQMLVLELVVY